MANKTTAQRLRSTSETTVTVNGTDTYYTLPIELTTTYKCGDESHYWESVRKCDSEWLVLDAKRIPRFVLTRCNDGEYTAACVSRHDHFVGRTNGRYCPIVQPGSTAVDALSKAAKRWVFFRTAE